MSTPVIVWAAIIALFVAAILVRFIVETVRYLRQERPRGIFDTGSEREEFFVPGDPGDNDEEDLPYGED